MPSPVAVRPGFAQWLTRSRQAAGLSQRELADHLGVGERTVRAWEAGEIRPSARSVRLIAKASGVSVVRLVDGGVTSAPPQPERLAAQRIA